MVDTSGARCFDVLSIDVGLRNLGFVFTSVRLPRTGEPTFDVHCLGHVDLTRMVHRRVRRHECRLRHDGHVSSRVLHFIQEHQDLFERATVVLVEQQPPTGLTAVEAVFHAKFYQKVRKISPTSLHSFFHIRHLSYEDRKAFMVRFADRQLRRFDAYRRTPRKHDVADAFAFVYFFCYRERTSLLRAAPNASAPEHRTGGAFDRFAYAGCFATSPLHSVLAGVAIESGSPINGPAACVTNDRSALVAVCPPAAVQANDTLAARASRVCEGCVGVVDGSVALTTEGGIDVGGGVGGIGGVGGCQGDSGCGCGSDCDV